MKNKREGHPPMTPEGAKDLALRALRGDSYREIAEATGYASSYVPKVIKSPIVKRNMQEFMRANGLDEAVVIKELKRHLRSKKVIFATHKGKITDTMKVDDNTNQRETLALVGDFLGVSPFRKIQQDGGGGPKLVINVNPVFAQAFFGKGTHHGDSDRYAEQLALEPVQSRPSGAEDLGVPETHDSG